jgi:CRP-like cAMP-binding protein
MLTFKNSQQKFKKFKNSSGTNNSDKENPILDEKVTSLAQYIESKISSGILPQDISLPLTTFEHYEILEYLMSKTIRASHEIIFIKHYLCSFQKYQVKRTFHFYNQNDQLSKLAVCIRLEKTEANKIVCLLGEIGDKFYMIFKGSVSIIIPVPYESELTETQYSIYLKKLFDLEEYDLFEKTMLSNKHIHIPSKLYHLFEQLDKYIEKPRSYRHNHVDEYIKSIAPGPFNDDECLSPTHRNDTKKIKAYLYTYKVICSTKEGESFGDISLRKTEVNKRTATIITNEDCIFGTITKQAYDMCMKETQEKIRKSNIESVYSQSIFKCFSYDYFEKNYFNMFKLITKSQGQYLFKQGDKREDIFILKEGEIEFTLKGCLKDFDFIIQGLGGTEDKTNYKKYNDLISWVNHYNKLINKSKLFRILKINKNDIIGLDEYIINNNFYLDAKVISNTCTVFSLDMHFCDTIFNNKIIKDLIVKEIQTRKEMMLNRFKNIKKTIIHKFYTNLKRDLDTQNKQFSYLEYASNLRLLKHKQMKVSNNKENHKNNYISDKTENNSVFMRNNKIHHTAHKIHRNKIYFSPGQRTTTPTSFNYPNNTSHYNSLLSNTIYNKPQTLLLTELSVKPKLKYFCTNLKKNRFHFRNSKLQALSEPNEAIPNIKSKSIETTTLQNRKNSSYHNRIIKKNEYYIDNINILKQTDDNFPMAVSINARIKNRPKSNISEELSAHLKNQTELLSTRKHVSPFSLKLPIKYKKITPHNFNSNKMNKRFSECLHNKDISNVLDKRRSLGMQKMINCTNLK